MESVRSQEAPNQERAKQWVFMFVVGILMAVGAALQFIS